MGRALLTGGAYSARSLIANCQRSINLYAESNPESSSPPVPVTQYPTPGLILLGTAPDATVMRMVYRASNGDLYAVCGPSVYYVTPAWMFTLLGTITSATTRVSLADNGLVIVLVDGTPNGYTIDMTTRAFAAIVDPDFFGADRVDVIDTFFIFNKPGTNQFYISGSEATTFDPLDIAAKTGWSDAIVSLIAVHRELWLIGSITSEVWYNSGAADFTFQAMPGAFIDHGCVAKYSVAKQDLSVFWLGQDQQGLGMVFEGSNYQAKRISTHAIENEFLTYSTLADAIGITYQQEGHVFYVLTFPAADKTWVYDKATGLWHQRAWSDSNGVLHRHRANCVTFAYGRTVVGDWQNGNLYALDLNTFTDNGAPIVHIRSFPHMVDSAYRVFYYNFIADMQVGMGDGGITTETEPPLVSLRWSDDRGASWGNPLTASLGTTGEYLTSVQFNRLGMARDRVFELSWSAPVMTALNGAWITSKASGD